MNLAITFLTDLVADTDAQLRRVQNLIDHGQPMPERLAALEDERMQLAAKIEPARAALADLKRFKINLEAERKICESREQMYRLAEQAKAKTAQKNAQQPA